MIAFESTETIARPAREIWEYASDIARHPAWMNVTSARIVSGTATEVGARAVEGMRFGSKPMDLELEVVTAEAGRRIGWRVVGRGPLRGEVTLQLEALGPDSTRATWLGSFGLSGLWRLVEPFMAREMRDGEAAELRRLKSILESRADQPA